MDKDLVLNEICNDISCLNKIEIRPNDKICNVQVIIDGYYFSKDYDIDEYKNRILEIIHKIV